MTSESMKRKRTTLLDELDELRNKPEAIKRKRPYTAHKSNKWKRIRVIIFIGILILVVAFIHIIKQSQKPHILIESNDNTITTHHTYENTDNEHSLSHTDDLLKDLNEELINTGDIIIKHYKTKLQSTTSMEDALSFTNEDCTTKLECGRCWLYNNLNIVIEISSIIPIPNDKLHISYKNLNLLTYWITFRSINNELCIAKDITIYISISDINSESVGGLAIPDSTSLCGWKYKWIISQPGNYTIIAYVLYYRGYLDFNQNKCNNSRNIEYIDTSLNEEYTLTKLPPKWRFYGQVEGCCEWCNRMKNKCKSWSSGHGNDRCILFQQSPFDVNSNIKIEKHNGYISGIYRNEPQQWYLGSLLNIQPNQCHHTTLDLIYGSGMKYTIKHNKIDIYTSSNTLCKTNHEMGRWISINNIDCNSINEFNSWCWIKKLNTIPQFKELPFRWKAYQCSYKQRTPENINKCLIEKNVNRIAVGGDSLIRLFSLEIVRYIFGEPTVKGNNVEGWSYSKHYQQNDIQIWFMGYDHKIDDISFMKEFIISPDNINKPNVFIHNFQIIHKIWHYNVIEFKYKINEYKNMANELFTKYYGKQEDGNWPIRMVFEAPLLVSEREYHDTADRAIIYNNIMKNILESDGWIFIPVLEISKARMYDSTGERSGVIDGMHMSGNILIEIARITIDMLCRFDFKNHLPTKQLNPLYMSV
eukprot:373632_1